MFPNNPMPPQNQLPGQYPPPSPQQDPYGFITNTPQASGGSLGPSSMKGRIILVASGIIILIIIAVIIFSILGNAGKAQTEQYVGIAKSQTEIIRISTLAEQKAKTLEGRSLATTIRLSFTSAQKDLSSMITKNGVNQKELTKQLSASKNPKSDELLGEAERNNRYDETYAELIKNEIEDYKKLLNSAAGGASGSERKTLEAAFDQASLIFTGTK